MGKHLASLATFSTCPSVDWWDGQAYKEECGVLGVKLWFYIFFLQLQMFSVSLGLNDVDESA